MILVLDNLFLSGLYANIWRSLLTEPSLGQSTGSRRVVLVWPVVFYSLVNGLLPLQTLVFFLLDQLLGTLPICLGNGGAFQERFLFVESFH